MTPNDSSWLFVIPFLVFVGAWLGVWLLSRSRSRSTERVGDQEAIRVGDKRFETGSDDGQRRSA